MRKTEFTDSSLPGISPRSAQTWFYNFPRMLAYQRKRLETGQAILRGEKSFLLDLGRFSDKIMEIVKKKQHFFWKPNKRNLFHRKVEFQHMEQFVCDRFSF